MNLNPEMLMGLVRHVLTFGGGYLVGEGVLTEVNAEAIIGAIMTIIGALWSVRAKAPPPPPPQVGGLR